jgi:hypothetical protein
MQQGEKLSGVPLHSITTSSSDIKHWEGSIWWNFDFHIGEAMFVQIIFKNSVRTSKRTQHSTITKIKWITLFTETIPVYSQEHMKATTKYSLTDC